MGKNAKKGKSKVAVNPLRSKVAEAKKVVNPLFEKRPKNFGIGKFWRKKKKSFEAEYKQT